MQFPVRRMRRLRQNESFRTIFKENAIDPNKLILPIFIVEGLLVPKEIKSMPGVTQLSVKDVGRFAKEARNLGLLGMILFGVPARKDLIGSSASDPEGVIPLTIKEIKENVPDMIVITDVCLCEYTDHGHCGILRGNEVDNDATLIRLCEESIVHSRAGADIIAPSDMMDGRVQAIRRALDDNGFSNVAILSYAVKFASSFYGPFREAALSKPTFGDRKGYQMDPANTKEAIMEAKLDIDEGADMLMVKPALPYLDILAKIKEISLIPTGAYQVSGEYSMIKSAANKGFIDERSVVMESLLCIKRAGADFILTYFALDVLRWLNE